MSDSNNTSPQPQANTAAKPAAAAAAPAKGKNVTLFVGNLSTEVDEPYLRRLFAAYAEVKRVCVYRQPELHALIEVSSYDDADTAIAALHCRYCMAPNVPVLVLYHKTNPVVTAYGKAVWEAYVEANTKPDGMNALYREALDSKGLGDVKQDGSTCPPPGAPLMVLPRHVALESYDPLLPRRKPPTIPPDIIQLGKMYLQNEAMGGNQRGGGGDSRGGGGSNNRGGGRGRFTHQFTTSLIPGVDAPSSGLNRHRGARGGGGPQGYRGGSGGMRGGGRGGGYSRGGMDNNMYQHHQHHQQPLHQHSHHSQGMYAQHIPPQYSHDYSHHHHHMQQHMHHQQQQQQNPYVGGQQPYGGMPGGYGMPPSHQMYSQQQH